MNSRVSLYVAEEYFLTRTIYRNFFNSSEITKDFNLLADFDNVDNLTCAMDNVPADVVLIDVHLHWIKGLEFARDLKEKFPDTKIILIAAIDSIIILNKALALGVDAFILDETPMFKLLEIIKRVIKGEKCIDDFYTKYIYQRTMDIGNLCVCDLVNSLPMLKGKILN